MRLDNSSDKDLRRRTFIGILIAILSFSFPADATDKPVFEDPAMKGSLAWKDYPSISAEYRGHWADRIENCYASADRGRQVNISDIAIGFETVLQVEGYSDHPAVAVSLLSEDGTRYRLLMDISLDNKFLSLQREGIEPPLLFSRCPEMTRPTHLYNEADAGWGNQARGACQSNQFDMFFEAFVASKWVQRHSLAPKIRIVTPGRSRSKRSHQYLRLPIRLIDYHYAINDASRAPEHVTTEIVSLPNGAYRVNWVRSAIQDLQEGEAYGAQPTYGPPGWLKFVRDRQNCWKLIEDGVGNAE
jgi:hypothetical protein